jgi:hypothetical protein
LLSLHRHRPRSRQVGKVPRTHCFLVRSKNNNQRGYLYHSPPIQILLYSYSSFIVQSGLTIRPPRYHSQRSAVTWFFLRDRGIDAFSHAREGGIYSRSEAIERNCGRNGAIVSLRYVRQCQREDAGHFRPGLAWSRAMLQECSAPYTTLHYPVPGPDLRLRLDSASLGGQATGPEPAYRSRLRGASASLCKGLTRSIS